MDVPEEIMIEILSWLPVKSLIRFRCVSKTWFTLLCTNPRLINLHLNRSIINQNQNPSIITSGSILSNLEYSRVYYADDYTACNKAIIINKPANPSSFVNICHGLICLSHPHQDEVYVWNPLTKDHIVIPCPPIPPQVNLMDTVFGFGYCKDTNEYKVIRLVSTAITVYYHKVKFDSLVSVYALGTGSWRNLEENIMQYNISLSNLCVPLVNGALHWYATRSSQLHYCYVHVVLVSFDLKDESFQEIPQPEGLRYYNPYQTRAAELGGCLSIFCACQGAGVEIWVMKEYGVADSWTKQYNFESPERSGAFTYMTPLGFTKDGEIIIKKDPGIELFLYDSKTTSIRDLNSFEFKVCDTYVYTPSLISPRILNGAMHDAAVGED